MTGAAAMPRTGGHALHRHLRAAVATALAAAVERGVPPGWTGWRWIRHETVHAHFRRRGAAFAADRYETVHPEAVAHNPLPRNIGTPALLPADPGWWGYSFRDVPARTSGETFIATIADARVAWYRDPARGGDFHPAIVTDDGRSLDLREIRFRPGHGAVLRGAGPPARLRKATWIIERVYDNHSHWLTAHLPKLLLLRDRGELADMQLPPQRTAAIDSSLRMLGLPPEQFATFDPARPLRVGELTILGTDRFRPELLRLIPRAFGVLDAPAPWRRVFISRAGASRRRLANEDELWPLLAAAGFERVRMEALAFEEQVALMRQTSVLCGPHGAGLTNMLFCPPGAHIVEIADPGFPNPNFYALAAALGHDYWILPATSHGDTRPLDRDLSIDPALLRQTLPMWAG
jgi:hypothetical protein